MENIEQISKKGSLMTFRNDIKVLDCTIRDGGLVNNFEFTDEFVKNLYKACSDAGVDYMELGYKASKRIFAPSDFGKWKFCNEDDIRVIADSDSKLKLSVMIDVDRTDYHTDVLPKSESALDMIRVATYIHQIPKALDMIKDAHDKGYETSVNLMSISTVKESELDEALEVLANSETNLIYLVDSFGALYPEQIRALAIKYLEFANLTGKSIGIHAHNNQQLAFANTIEALTLGVSYADVTVSGLGRGAGNCPEELILGFLKNPKYHLRPVLEFIQNNIPQLKSKGVNWGFDLPYMLTGQLNIHPRDAISFLASEDKEKCLKFFDKVTSEVD